MELIKNYTIDTIRYTKNFSSKVKEKAQEKVTSKVTVAKETVVSTKNKVSKLKTDTTKYLINSKHSAYEQYSNATNQINEKFNEKTSNVTNKVTDKVEKIVEKLGLEELNSPCHFTLQQEIDKCSLILKRFIIPSYSSTSFKNSDNIISNKDTLLDNCKGMIIISSIKYGFWGSFKFGTGVLFTKLSNDRWSPPSAIGLSGLGWGCQGGIHSLDQVFLLMTNEAVSAFKNSKQISIGGELSCSAGIYGGRSIEGHKVFSPSSLQQSNNKKNSSSSTSTAIYAYSNSKGYFAGSSLEGMIFFSRDKLNNEFYGENVSVHDILNGNCNYGCNALFDTLEQRKYLSY